MSRQTRDVLRLLGVFVASPALLGLSACTPADQISVRSTSSGLTFVSCESTSYQTLEVAASPKDTERTQYSTVWRTSGDGVISKGDQIDLGTDPPGMQTETGPLPFVVQDSYLVITFERYGADGQLEDEAYALFDGSKIASDFWLTSAGARTLAPCG